MGKPEVSQAEKPRWRRPERPKLGMLRKVASYEYMPAEYTRAGSMPIDMEYAVGYGDNPWRCGCHDHDDDDDDDDDILPVSVTRVQTAPAGPHNSASLANVEADRGASSWSVA